MEVRHGLKKRKLESLANAKVTRDSIVYHAYVIASHKLNGWPISALGMKIQKI